MRTDYIFILSGRVPFPIKGISPARLSRTPIVNFFTSGIVVEHCLSAFAADCPLKKSRGFNLALIQQIFSAFATFTLTPFKALRCSFVIFRVFQQLDTYFFMQFPLHGLYLAKVMMVARNFSNR